MRNQWKLNLICVLQMDKVNRSALTNSSLLIFTHTQQKAVSTPQKTITITHVTLN
jgi:hypothetical protein